MTKLVSRLQFPGINIGLLFSLSREEYEKYNKRDVSVNEFLDDASVLSEVQKKLLSGYRMWDNTQVVLRGNPGWYHFVKIRHTDPKRPNFTMYVISEDEDQDTIDKHFSPYYTDSFNVSHQA